MDSMSLHHPAGSIAASGEIPSHYYCIIVEYMYLSITFLACICFVRFLFYIIISTDITVYFICLCSFCVSCFSLVGLCISFY